MTEPDNTSTRTLQRAADIGKTAGLNYVYGGNIPGRVGDLENTRCPNCQELLIARFGYQIQEYKLTSDGRCPSCGKEIAGRWSSEFQGQKSSRPFIPGW
jgi:pyruvate formate lyase activating enzyme